ncbi:MAG: ZPR1 zinc finger domain-containing protein [Thermoplasmata archaeon]
MKGPKENETDEKCPVCNSNLFLIQYETKIAYEGDILITTYYCRKCGYRKTETYGREENNPVRITFKVSKPDDLRTIVYRSNRADIYIPEIEASIDAAEHSTGEITTVEGIVYRISETFSIMSSDEADIEKADSIRKKIEGILSGKFYKFTLIITDDSGKSVVQSERAIVEHL